MIKLDKAILIPLNPKQGKYMNDTIFQNLINKFTQKVQVGVSDKMFYTPISESFVANNKDYRAMALSVSQDCDKYAGHMLEICVLHPAKQREYKRPLVYGNKETILNYLKDKNILNNIKQDFNAILDEIKLT